VTTELFLLGVTTDLLQVNIDWKSSFLKGGVIWSKISGRHLPTTILRDTKLDASILLVA